MTQLDIDIEAAIRRCNERIEERCRFYKAYSDLLYIWNNLGILPYCSNMGEVAYKIYGMDNSLYVPNNYFK
jgi:hypothetical protein